MAGTDRVTQIAREVAGEAEPFRPLSVRSEATVDYEGEPGLTITAVLPAAAFGREGLGRWINATAAAIWRRLVEEGEMRFPYLEVRSDVDQQQS